MKRNAFVLVLLILIIAPLGCRRRQGLFGGLRGDQCAGQTSYSAGAAVPSCPVGTTAYGGEIYGGGSVIDGGVIDGGTYSGGVIDGGIIDGGVINGGVINGGMEDYNSSTIQGGFPSIGSENMPANLAPSLGSSNIYGRPMFQVVGDRKLAPGETLPGENDITPPTKSDQTAKAPIKK